MGPPSTDPCAGCPHLAKALARIAVLEARMAELEVKVAQATRTSATSSKPPSSDIVSPPRPRHRGRRDIGA